MDTRYVEKAKAGLSRQKKSVIVDQQLDELYTKHGCVTQQLLVDSARDATSPLHGYFEWNDTAAGEKWRIQQALHLIMTSKFVAVLQKHDDARLLTVAQAYPVRRLLPQFGDKGFKMRAEVLDEEDARRQLVERKLGALRAWCKGVVDIEELRPMRKAILDLLPVG